MKPALLSKDGGACWNCVSLAEMAAFMKPTEPPQEGSAASDDQTIAWDVRTCHFISANADLHTRVDVDDTSDLHLFWDHDPSNTRDMPLEAMLCNTHQHYKGGKKARIVSWLCVLHAPGS